MRTSPRSPTSAATPATPSGNTVNAWNRMGEARAAEAQANHAAAGIAGDIVDQPPEHSGPPRRDDEDRRDGAGIAERGVSRQQQRRQARRMNRVDAAIDAAPQIVRRQLTAEEADVVAAFVVVVDRQVAVTPQALGDHQIVRLVAAGQDRAHRGVGGGEEDQRHGAGQPAAAPSIRQPGGHARRPGRPIDDHASDARRDGGHPRQPCQRPEPGEARGAERQRQPRQDDDQQGAPRGDRPRRQPRPGPRGASPRHDDGEARGCQHDDAAPSRAARRATIRPTRGGCGCPG